jgi:CRP/FNR family transcriptional regulator, cyclic AMP receptor protein
MSQSIPDAVLRGAGRGGTEVQPEVAMRRTRRETAAVLGQVPLFSDFSKRHLGRLAKETDELTFAPGERIVEEGNPGETLYVVLSGKGRVTRKGKKVGEVVPGDFFGELSALDGGPRTATIAAETPMRVLRLFRRTLAALLRDEPQVSIKLLTGMARRIRDVDRRSG